MKKLLFVPVILMLIFLAGCSTPSNPSESYKGQTPAQIYAEGKSQLRKKNVSDAIKHFEALDVQYPFGEETENAQLYLIYAYYLKEDYALSTSAADRFIRMHPTNSHVDYAYFMRGLAHFYEKMGVLEKIFTINLATRDLTQLQKSYTDFREVITHFPNSQYAGIAHQYLIYLRNIMAEHEYNIAEYYYTRKAYVAAADRASDVVTGYQGAPVVPEGLLLMSKSYHQLGLTKLEQETLLILKYNYPDTYFVNATKK